MCARGVHRSADLLFLVSLVVQSFRLKMHPEYVAASGMRLQSIVHLVLIGLLISKNLRVIYLFDRNDLDREDRASTDAVLHQMQRLRNTYAWALQQGMHVDFFAYTFALVGCVMILTDYLPAYDTLDRTSDWWAAGGGDGSSAGSTRRVLRAGGGGASSADSEVYGSWEIVNEQTWALFWIVQSLGLLLFCIHIMNSIFIPFERLSVLYNTIWQMLRGDVGPFLYAWLSFLGAFYIALYILFPRTGEANTLPHAPTFNSPYEALFALVDLSFIGEKVEFNLMHQDSFGALSSWQVVALFAWIALYYLFMIVSLILLINLLIAMMSATYAEVFDDSTLRARLTLASYLLKLELIARSLSMEVRVGETTPSGNYVYEFRAVSHQHEDEDSDSDDGYEGDFESGGSDPFAPPVPSQTSRMFGFLRDLRAELTARLSAVEQESSSAVASLALQTRPRGGKTKAHPLLHAKEVLLQQSRGREQQRQRSAGRSSGAGSASARSDEVVEESPAALRTAPNGAPVTEGEPAGGAGGVE